MTIRKKYTIEVPVHSSPIEHLIKLNQQPNIQIAMYGSVPDSPLNGGRFNYSLDGIFLWDRLLFRLTKKQLSDVTTNFYNTLTKANQNNLPFRIAYTNMYVDPEELSEKNLYPVEWIADSFKKYGVKNGLILNNTTLENFIRKKFGDKLVYISSCTKYVSPHKILTPRETLSLYLEDSKKYDYLVLTPQDSRRENLIKDVLRDSQCPIIAICNSYCANNCNSYYHYELMSRENKKSLLNVRDMDIVMGALRFFMERITKCSAVRHRFCKVNVNKIALMQLNAGVTNFKLGRGLGAELIDQLIALILAFEKGNPPHPFRHQPF